MAKKKQSKKKRPARQNVAEQIVTEKFPHLKVVKAPARKSRPMAKSDAQLPNSRTIRRKYRGIAATADAADAAAAGAAESADDDISVVEVVPESQSTGDAGVSQNRLIVVSKSKRKILGFQG